MLRKEPHYTERKMFNWVNVEEQTQGEMVLDRGRYRAEMLTKVISVTSTFLPSIPSRCNYAGFQWKSNIKYIVL